MTMKTDTKIEVELTCRFKIDMRNFTHLTRALESLKNLFKLVPCDQSIYCLSCKNTEELFFVTPKRYANFWKKLTCGLKKDLRNLANFHQSSWKCQIWTLMGSFCPEELCVMTIRNNAKFEEELTRYFKIDMRNLTNFDSSTQKSKKIDL